MDISPAEFTTVHDRFLHKWKKTMETGDTTFVERMSPDYYVTFFMENRKPTYFNRSETIKGLRHSFKESVGQFTKNFENRVIRMKATNHVLVFYEQVLIENDQVNGC